VGTQRESRHRPTRLADARLLDTLLTHGRITEDSQQSALCLARECISWRQPTTIAAGASRSELLPADAGHQLMGHWELEGRARNRDTVVEEDRLTEGRHARAVPDECTPADDAEHGQKSPVQDGKEKQFGVLLRLTQACAASLSELRTSKVIKLRRSIT
jgi:hypothetical protein